MIFEMIAFIFRTRARHPASNLCTEGIAYELEKKRKITISLTSQGRYRKARLTLEGVVSFQEKGSL